MACAHCGWRRRAAPWHWQAVDVGAPLTGQDELPPGQSAFISAAGVPSPHFCDQVSLFNDFRYKNMPPA
jgi:hypothetical protein